MADELLNSSLRLPSADMFSLGLTLYELCCFFAEPSTRSNSSGRVAAQKEGELRFTVLHRLPDRDTLWHILREDNAPPIPAGRSAVLQQVVATCMRRSPEARPSAQQLLAVQEVRDTLDDVDPVLLCAPRHADALSRGGAPLLARSASMQAMEGMPSHAYPGGSGAGIVGTSSVPSAAQGLSISVGADNQIDYAALGDGAFTPNFSHSSYANYSPR